MRTISFLFVGLALLLVGSLYGADEGTPPPDYKGQVAERPTLMKGDRWGFVLRKQPYTEEFMGVRDGNLVFRAQWEDGKRWTTFRTPDLNLAKVLYKKDEVKEQCDPSCDPLSFPLWVGKKWSYSYRSIKIIEAGKPYSDMIDSDVKVIAYEQVTVPAGTYGAFKIEEVRRPRSAKGPQARLGYHVTVWYSPEVKAVIKRVEDDDSKNTELTKYVPKSP